MVTAAAAGSDRELELLGFYRRMSGAVALAGCVGIRRCFCRSWIFGHGRLFRWSVPGRCHQPSHGG